MSQFESGHWALILGGSSGFGLATAKKLAEQGLNVCVVHRDRRGAMDRIEKDFETIRSHGRGFIALNVDALSADGMNSVISTLREKLGETGKVKTVLHSIAFGNLKSIVPTTEKSPILEEEDMTRTIQSMGTSYLTWVQKLFEAGLFAKDVRAFALTSEGNEVAWRGYAAVAAAKCALESVSRSIAFEFGPHGIRSNIIQAGITDTPALRLIPGSEQMKNNALARNPLKRLTTPEDVADVVYLLSREEARWINGALIRVDGGEHIGSA
jgi:NAD(P)-dependent dehydrogenase (short-subunit alcohol dehydrogenase family)